MHRNFGLLSPGNESSHSVALPIFFFGSCVQCFRLSIPSAVRPTLLRQMDMGSLTGAQMWERAVHTQGGQAQRRLRKKLIGGTAKLPFALPRQGIEPGVSGFEFRLSNH